jgi:CheY-like chemotaxis protein
MTQEKYRILLVEDNPGDVRLISEYLNEANGPHFELVFAERLSEGIATLARNKIDLVLLDLNLPDCQGFETFKRM